MQISNYRSNSKESISILQRLIETFRVDDMAIKALNGNIKELWCSQGVNNS